MPPHHRPHPRRAPARLLATAALCLCAGIAQATAPAHEPGMQDAGGAAVTARTVTARTVGAEDLGVPGTAIGPATRAAEAPTVGPAAASARAAPIRVFQGKASFYAAKFTGRSTANGERYSPQALTMAHRALPFGSWVRVTNLQNQRSVVVRVNDRGPFIGRRVADLSKAAARQLNMVTAGVVMARFEVLPGPPADGLDGTVEAEADRATPSGG